MPNSATVRTEPLLFGRPISGGQFMAACPMALDGNGKVVLENGTPICAIHHAPLVERTRVRLGGVSGPRSSFARKGERLRWPTTSNNQPTARARSTWCPVAGRPPRAMQLPHRVPRRCYRGWPRQFSHLNSAETTSARRSRSRALRHVVRLQVVVVRHMHDRRPERSGVLA